MKSIVIVVFDGLQPAQVTQELMPNLAAFASSGVVFANHHPVYPTVTRTNVATMVTGRSPGGHGLAGNTLVVRDFDPTRAIPALEHQLAQVARKTGRALLAPTLAEMLSRHGQEYIAIGVGTSGNAYLQNPTAELCGGATIHPQFTLPGSLNDEIVARFGPWPEEMLPNTPRMAHALRILTEYILPVPSPAVSLIWSSEPDKSQHAEGVGSPLANAALRAADQQFGRLLGWLEQTGRLTGTDLIVVSDHGYSTISAPVAIEALVRDAGFPPGGEPGGVVVAPNGGSALFYTHQGDRDTAGRLAAWLMGQPWCGVVIASEKAGEIPGTFSASLVGGEGLRAPEIAMSFRWDSSPNDAGYPGHVYAAGGAPGVGQHGSMSRHELRNVLFARGPSFKGGIRVDTPSGNIDLVPTILRILDISSLDAVDGRVLEEALLDGPAVSLSDWTTEVDTAERALGDHIFRQQITVSRVGSATYVDEGNGALWDRVGGCPSALL